MGETDKPLTKDALLSMQVIDAQGKIVGKVKDLTFAIGKNGISLTVENEKGETQIIAWEEVQAASDFIILRKKPQNAVQTQSTQQQPSSQPLCPTCGKPLTWIPQYQRWYCYNDKKYA
jgi:sporulation protein YlmC with PRC-barrel domain